MVGLFMVMVGLFVLGLAIYRRRSDGVISERRLRRLMLKVFDDVYDIKDFRSLDIDFYLYIRYSDLICPDKKRRMLQLGNIGLSVSKIRRLHWFGVFDCPENANWSIKSNNLEKVKRGTLAYTEMKRVYHKRLLDLQEAIKIEKDKKNDELLKIIHNEKRMHCPCCDNEMYAKQEVGEVFFCTGCDNIVITAKKDGEIVLMLDGEEWEEKLEEKSPSEKEAFIYTVG